MSSYSHIAILGRQPELGFVELESLVGSAQVLPFGGNAALIAKAPRIDQLGGVIKLAEILYEGPAIDLLDTNINFESLLRGDGKTTFGLSYYGTRATSRFVLATGLNLKKRLRPAGPVRMVAPTVGTALSAAQLHYNKLLEDGFELLVVVHKQQMVVARTTGVQDVDSYAARDHGRPARSAKVGMLPPKLAQILLNTTHGGLVVDPFCGTGVVLQEALLMGRPVIGFDLAAEMVAATKTNLAWLVERTPTPLPTWRVSEADARSVELPNEAVSIVSEGYLGTNLSSAPNQTQVNELDGSISDLYRATLSNLARQLPSGAELSLCVPNWRLASGWHVPAVVDEVANLGYTFKVFKHAPGPLRYARSDQTVGRQLLLLTRL